MSSPKKIVRLFSRLNIGGPALHVVNLAVGLEDFGYTTILAVGRTDDAEGTLEDYAHAQGTKLVVIPDFQAAISPWKDLLAFVRIFQLLRRERPEIVHTHTFKAGLLGRIAAKLAGVPTVVHTYHGHLFTGYGSQFKARIIRFIEAGLARLTDRIIAVSAQVGQDLVTLGVAKEKQIRVVELGFNMHKINSDFAKAPTLRRDLGLGDEAILVGVVGRLVPVKAIDLFLEALTPLLHDRPNLHLAIIGDGGERARLETLARSLSPHSTQIHFTGWRRPATSDLADLDLCICCSKNEGTSVSIIEAVIAQIPVISTRVGGMSDLLENGKWGELIENDRLALRTAVDNFLSEEITGFDDLGAGAAYFRDRFSLPRLLRDIHATYVETFDHA